MALPINVGSGTVVGRFIDSEGNPITGQFTFTPTPDNLKNITAVPPVTILPKAVTATLDLNGDLSVSLVATDDPDNNPSGWTYTVTFSSSTAKITPFSIAVPEGSTQDLAVIMPVASSEGDAVVRGLGVATGGTTGQVLSKASNLDGETEWVDLDASRTTFTSGTGLAATTVAGGLDELDASKADQIAVTDLDTRVTNLEAVDPPPSQRVRLAADFTGTASNIVFEDVTGMAITLGANEEWDFEILLHVTGSETADMEFEFTGPAGVTLFAARAFGLPGGAGALGGGARPVSVMALGENTGKMGLVGAGPVPIEFKGTIVNGGVAGTLQLRACQSVSDPTPHVVKAGSSFTAVQVA